MNEYLRVLMDKPSVLTLTCCVCGSNWPLSRHHVVPRSQGGKDGPTLVLCGHGTAGCHGKAEDKRLHFRFTDRWEFL